MTGQYLNPDGSEWVPAFATQRPPFQRGHKLSVGNKGGMLHGATSPRYVQPLAEQIAAEMRADIDYLGTPRFAERLGAYSRAEARARLYGAWVENLTIAEAASNPDGDPPLEVLRKLETRAANMADRLGLNPSSAHLYSREIELSRRTLERRAERDQLQADTRAAMRQQWYGDES